MKFLLGACLFLLLIYIVAGSAITSITSIGEKVGGEGGGRAQTYSPFKVTFRDQFLCYQFDQGDWVMRGYDTGDRCKGPFFDSVNLCRAMEEEGQTRVQLLEGRVLECS